MDRLDSQWFPSRRDLRSTRSRRDSARRETLRFRLNSAAAVVLIGAIIMLGTIGLLRVLVPTDIPDGASSSQEVSGEQQEVPSESWYREETSAGRDTSGSEDASREQSLGEPNSLIVFVTGAVNQPGVVSVPVGSRLEVAVSEAGGLTSQADLVSVNLARTIEDGEHIHVLAEGERQTSPDLASGGQTFGDPAQPGGCVDLNVADQAQLETLDGVGPKTAQRIMQWREANGGFSANEELLAISGIGEKLYAKILVGLCEG